MPGIVGLFTKLPPHLAAGHLRRMLSPLRHESFYVSGTWIDETLGVYVGWTALQNSFCDRMPLSNESGELTLVFSGEEFSEQGTLAALKQRGHSFDDSGSEYLVHVAEEDPAFPAGLNGRFHGLLANRRDKTALLFNDRYDMRRLYYYEAKDAFYFACEAKAILAVCPELKRLDPTGLAEYVACGAVLENRTLFPGINVLPPGSAWKFRSGSLERKDAYFNPHEWEEQEKLDLDSYYKELQQAFARSLPHYFRGPQQIAMSLTGGLDTRMIMATRNPAPEALPCYTFGSMFRENQDVRVSRHVAALCRQPHQVITAGKEFLARFAHYAERAIYLTDGCVDVSRSPDLYLNERARQIAPVRMTGNYGGEVLRQVRGFKAEIPAPGLFQPEVHCEMKLAERKCMDLAHGHPVSFAVFKQARWSQCGILALEETQLTMRSPFLDNHFVRTAFRSPLSAFAGSEVSLRLIADGNPELSRIPTDRGAGEDRRVGAVSRSWLEFLFKAEYAYDMGMPQWMARVDGVLRPLHIERAFLGRHKPFHFRVWYRDFLAGYLQEMLLDSKSLLRSYVERRQLEKIVREHVRGKGNHTNKLHKVLSLELLHRLFLDSRTPECREKPAGTVASSCVPAAERGTGAVLQASSSSVRV